MADKDIGFVRQPFYKFIIELSNYKQYGSQNYDRQLLQSKLTTTLSACTRTTKWVWYRKKHANIKLPCLLAFKNPIELLRL